MYFFLSDDYTKPSVLIRDPESVSQELDDIRHALSLSEAQKEKLKNAKEVLSELSALVPESLAEELLSRITRAEEEHEALISTYRDRTEEWKEIAVTLGRSLEGRSCL